MFGTGALLVFATRPGADPPVVTLERHDTPIEHPPSKGRKRLREPNEPRMASDRHRRRAAREGHRLEKTDYADPRRDAAGIAECAHDSHTFPVVVASVTFLVAGAL